MTNLIRLVYIMHCSPFRSVFYLSTLESLRRTNLNLIHPVSSIDQSIQNALHHEEYLQQVEIHLLAKHDDVIIMCMVEGSSASLKSRCRISI